MNGRILEIRTELLPEMLGRSQGAQQRRRR
jgi:hypothetical protein